MTASIRVMGPCVFWHRRSVMVSTLVDLIMRAQGQEQDRLGTVVLYKFKDHTQVVARAARPAARERTSSFVRT